jgi:hypothetical protein
MPSIMSNLSSTFETFAGIMNENPTMLADLVKDATELISAGAEVLSWADEIKVALSLPFGPAGAQAGSDYFYRQIFGGTPQEIAAGMEQFPQIMGQFNHQASLAVSALLGMGGGSQEAAAAVRDLNTALTEHFDPAQRALDAEIRLKQALQEATRASKDKKMGEVDRLQAVQSLTRAIADSSRAEMERTGATTSAGKAFMEQLPRLLEWAGSNKAAQDTINGLAGSLSITIGRTKDGTIAIDRFGKAIQILPNGKKVEIDANTAKGKQQIQDLMLLIARQKGTIDVRVRTIYDTPSGQKALERKAKAAGGIERYAAGGIDYAAAEGMRARPQPPGIVSKPTILFGEGSSGRGATEAFIPYESQFRGRAIELLGRVAEDFGLEVYNRQAARTISDVGESVHVSAGSVTVAMGGALDALDAALGQSGSLTSAITMVGGVGEQMSAGWIDGSAALGDSVTGMSETMSTSVGGLTSSVQLLAEQVAAAAELTTGSRSGGVDATAKETRGKIGHSLKETRGVIAQPKPIVWNDSKIGVHAGGGVDYASTPGGMLQAATLRSVPAGSGGGAGSSAGGGGGGPLFTIEGGFHAAPDQSPYQIAQDLDWIRRGG